MSGSGRRAEHTFTSAGPKTVTLTVVSNGGLQGSMMATIVVHSLIAHDNPGGFRIPIPEDWSLRIGQTDADLLLEGPLYNQTPSWVRIFSNQDPAAMEDVPYVKSVETAVLQDLRTQCPDATVAMNSSYTRVWGHMADVLLVRCASGRIAVKLAIVVSGDHERWWALQFAVDYELYGYIDPMFNQMVEGFMITMPTPAQTLATAIAFLAVCGFGDLALVVFLAMWPRWALKKQQPRKGVAEARTPSTCPTCKTPTVVGAQFCWRCGETLSPNPRKE